MSVSAAEILSIALPPEAGLRPESRPVAEPTGIRALVEAARAGDADAFGRLVELNERVVVRTAMAAVGDVADAEDVAQEAFLLAWQKLDGFRGDASFRTWLLTITWRRALDRRRQRRAWWQRLLPVADDADAFDRIASLEADPERTAMSAEDAARVRRAIARLTPKLRDTLLLAASGEHTYDEIGALLRVPVGTVKWRVSEARRQLVKTLAPERPATGKETA